MSLLLDALKKAAKDKEASSAAAADASASNPTSNKEPAVDNNEDFELTLDDLPVAQSDSQQKAGDENKASPAPAEPPLSFDAEPASNQVSDEALQVLIYKTNHAHKRRRLLIWSGAMAASAVILIVSGVYFLKQIQQGIESLELRHRVNMRAVESEPVKATKLQLASQTKTGAENTKTDPVPLTKLPVKSVNNKAPVQKKPDVKNRKQIATRAAHRSAKQQQPARNGISVVRGEKKDPVGAILTTAWLAYNASDYAQAQNLYEQVLGREKNNRDALMGMGAIALKKNDTRSALEYYNKLLQLDPRDPVANAALLNMNNSAAEDTQSESKLLYLLQQQPDAAHLYYALGNKYALQSKWPEAESAYFSAFEHDNSSADYAYNLAVSLERIGQSKEAVKYYKSALQLALDSNISFSVDVVKKRLEQIQP
jgi:tetratricopeptide (TPR) repeat protein